jgi:hypothetical protein
MNSKRGIWVALFMFLFFSFVPFPSLAQCDDPSDPYGVGCGAATGLGSGDIRLTVIRIINVFLGLLGIIAVVLNVYAGYTWMTAGGNDDKVETAKKTILSATVGLAIILSAYAITRFVATNLYGATVRSGSLNAYDLFE